ncbi:MAG: winged helix-turn-helix transcriptional regulator [Chloroflexi bacterium]|nr:winged helix-turn-helix transcriptional regulator [Chloroflexota bacterium]
MSAQGSAAHDPFEALADPTRRAILDLLRRRETRTAGELAAAFPRISRPAVSRHLRVLREAGFVMAEEAGRERRYRLNAAALARMHRDWFARFTPLWEASLAQLKQRAEASERRTKRTPPRRRASG